MRSIFALSRNQLKSSSRRSTPALPLLCGRAKTISDLFIPPVPPTTSVRDSVQRNPTRQNQKRYPPGLDYRFRAAAAPVLKPHSDETQILFRNTGSHRYGACISRLLAAYARSHRRRRTRTRRAGGSRRYRQSRSVRSRRRHLLPSVPTRQSEAAKPFAAQSVSLRFDTACS